MIIGWTQERRARLKATRFHLRRLSAKARHDPDPKRLPIRMRFRGRGGRGPHGDGDRSMDQLRC